MEDESQLPIARGKKLVCQWIGMAFDPNDPSAAQACKKRYTYTPRLPYGAPRHVRPQPICLVHHDPATHMLYMPRDPQLLQQLAGHNVVDIQAKPTATTLTFQGQLDPRRYQDQAATAVLQQLRTSPHGGGALLSLPTGYGKTACALYITTQVATKILVLVHTRILADQWIERIAHFVPNARANIITTHNYGQGPQQWSQDTDYVIMLMQTLLCKASPDHGSICQTFHMVLVDETHHLAARTLCRAMELAGCRYRLGLSATVERKDGLHVMLDHLLGPLAFHMERETNPNVIVHTYTYMYHPPPTTQGLATPSPSAYAEALTQTADDPARTAFLTDIIQQWYAKGKYMVVMSDRRSQLQALATLLDTASIPFVYAVGGGTSPDVEDIRQTRPVVLATFGYAAEGMDLPVLDTCVLATSRCELKQCVGRILRTQGSEHRPVVCDIVDACVPILKRQAAKRRKWFESPLHKGGLAATLVDN